MLVLFGVGVCCAVVRAVSLVSHPTATKTGARVYPLALLED